MAELPVEADPGELTRLGLETYAHELDEHGLTVVPQSVLGLPDAFFTHLRDIVLAVAEQRTGARFDLNQGLDRSLGGPPGGDRSHLDHSPGESGSGV